MEALTAIRPMHDKPDRRPRTRVGWVQKPDIDGDPFRVILGYPGYGKQPVENWGFATFQGARVRTPWHQEGGVWVMETEGGLDLLVDGRPGPLNPPAQGWPMTVAGFGTPFPDAAEPSDPGNSASAVRIAFHPSGLAVLVAPMDGNGDMEMWRWVPGAGFGDKYPALNLGDAEDAIVLANPGSQFTYPRVDQSSQGRYAFSPDGNWLAIAGTFGEDHDGNDMPLVVVPFDLGSGLDLMSPVFPTSQTLGDGLTVAWSPDGAHIVLGSSDPPRIRAWNWTGSAFGAAEPDPASPPADPPFQIVFSANGRFLAAGTFNSTAADNPKAWNWTPGDGWGTVVAPPADPIPLNGEVQGLSWHPSRRHVLVVDVSGPIYLYAFDPSAGGSWGARTEIDDWNDEGLIPKGGSFSPDGTMVVVIGEDPPTARLYSFDGTAATFVEEITWAGNEPQTFASVAWRP